MNNTKAAAASFLNTINTALVEGDDKGVMIPRDAASITVNGRKGTYRYMMGTLALTLAAVELGAKPGDKITVRYWRFAPEHFTLIAEGGGNRTPEGVWAARA